MEKRSNHFGVTAEATADDVDAPSKQPDPWMLSLTSANGSSGVGSVASDPHSIASTGAGVEKRCIVKNLVFIGVAFLLIFVAFRGLGRLRGNLGRESPATGLDIISSSAFYGALVLSCAFLPSIVIARLGHRWTMAAAGVGFVVYAASNGYAVRSTLVPASVLVGLCTGPLWTAVCAHVVRLGERYARLAGETREAVVSGFFGIFFMIFQMREHVLAFLNSFKHSGSETCT